MSGTDNSELVDLSRRFVAEVFDALSRDYVIPTSRFSPHIRVGREYFGDAVHASPTYSTIEKSIEQAFPARFADKHPGEVWDFPSTYLFSLIEASVYRCSVAESSYEPTAAGVTDSIEEMLAELASDATGVAAARIVTHLTTATGGRLEIGDMVIEPGGGWDGLRKIGTLIPGTGAAVSREPPFIHGPPESVVFTTDSTDRDPWAKVEQLSGKIERFLLAVRLMTAATMRSGIEIRGGTVRVSRIGAHMVQFQVGGLADTLIRRTARLNESDAGPIAGLLKLVETSGGTRNGNLISSFDMALRLFNRSHQYAPWFEQLVDLSTALEAALIGEGDENSGLSLRLKSRAAALLATKADPAQNIFKDVGTLYNLRSTLVHGGDLKQRALTRAVDSLSTMPTDEMRGVAAERAVDRLRDLVRRSILARAALGDGDAPVWPFGSKTSVDAALADDGERNRWRNAWQERIALLGAPDALGPARRAVDALSQEDR